ncbi:MAG TPA: hypothetical protein VNA13_01945 [Xanthomonadales bacterium]|nr:hypothetical protein [Xanthomonadales bacterium]
MEENDSTAYLEGEQQDGSAITAARYSYKATLDYPGCAAAEGIELARLCKKFGTNPIELRDALLTDETQIQWLIAEGNKHHGLQDIDRVVARPRMVAMINSTFKTAQEVIENTKEELAAALAKYPNHKYVLGYDERGFERDVLPSLRKARTKRVRQQQSKIKIGRQVR